jgi:hypothetical protein
MKIKKKFFTASDSFYPKKSQNTPKTPFQPLEFKKFKISTDPKIIFFGANFKKVSEWSETCKNAIKNGGQKKTLNPHNFPQGHFRAKRKRQNCSARRDEHFGISYCRFGSRRFTKVYPHYRLTKSDGFFLHELDCNNEYQYCMIFIIKFT